MRKGRREEIGAIPDVMDSFAKYYREAMSARLDDEINSTSRLLFARLKEKRPFHEIESLLDSLRRLLLERDRE